jgi:hypothetical protein
MQSNFVISLADMRYVDIHCAQCATIVTMDMKGEKPFNARPGAFATKACPGCQRDYDSAIKGSIDGFKSAYQVLLNFPDSVTFRGVSSHEADDRV